MRQLQQLQADMDRMKAERDLARSQLEAEQAEARHLRRPAPRQPEAPVKSSEVLPLAARVSCACAASLKGMQAVHMPEGQTCRPGNCWSCTELDHGRCHMSCH